MKPLNETITMGNNSFIRALLAIAVLYAFGVVFISLLSFALVTLFF
ncbi:hypothetical protein [Brenneria corticis]|nr:hypothetical protein [Brenneria sp. CFCC 11842]